VNEPVAVFERVPLASTARYVKVSGVEVQYSGVGIKKTLVPPVMERVPPVDGWVRPVRDVMALSTSVSFEVTAMVRFVSSVPVAVSLFAIGASLTQVMVMVPVAVLLAVGQKASLRRKLKVSVPQ
jgi:hypothetical protein